MTTQPCPTPEEYFLETGPYQRVPLGTEQTLVGLARIQFYISTLDCYCVECGQHSVFRSTESLPDLGVSLVRNTASSVDDLLESSHAWLPPVDDQTGSLHRQEVRIYLREPKTFATRFQCSRETAHSLQFYTRVRATYFEKIGQSPSLADLHLGDLSRYRKVLGDRYAELARGVGLHAHGIGIGSFVYLRRILEQLIEEAHAKAATMATWNEGTFQTSRMEERIQLLKDVLPPIVVENRAVYGILSKGIHELSEQECSEYFPVLRAAIELMLDEKMATIEREKKSVLTKNAISNIVGRIKGGST